MTKHGKKPSANGALSEAPAELLIHESPTETDERTASDEQIRMRAYEIYLLRGDEFGDCVGDWLRAEHECREGWAVRLENREAMETAAGD